MTHAERVYQHLKHLPDLHLWWARRTLAAVRAVIFAQLAWAGTPP